MDIEYYYSGNKTTKFPSFRRMPESIEKTGCRIKPGMTALEIFTAGVIIWLLVIVFLKAEETMVRKLKEEKNEHH